MNQYSNIVVKKIVDSTKAMRPTLWGEAIDKVEIDKSYQFTT